MYVNKLKLGLFIVCLVSVSSVFAAGQKDTEDPIDPALLNEATTIELSGDAVATVNGKTITKTEFDVKINQLKENYASRGQNIPDAQLEQMKGQLLDSLISQMVLLDKCDLLDIEADSNSVDQQFNGFKGQFPSDEEYKNALTAYGYTEESLLEEIETSIRINTLFTKEVIPSVGEITEQEALDFYNNNPREFTQPEQVRASHILFTVEKGASAEDKAVALTKAEEVLAMAKGGQDFAELAKEHSQGPSGPKGGDLNYFGKGQMVKPFEDAVFTMAVGDVSDIVETQFGYHIIKLTDKKAQEVVDFNQYKEQIKQSMKQQKIQTAIEAYVKRVVEEADVKRSL